MSTKPACVLHILSGVHAGTAQRLEPDAYSIGASSEAAIVLHDIEMAPLHVLLDVTAGQQRITALAPGVCLEGSDVALEPNAARDIALPLGFTVGTTAFRLTDAAPVPRSQNLPLIAVALLGLAVVVGAALISLSPQAEGDVDQVAVLKSGAMPLLEASGPHPISPPRTAGRPAKASVTANLLVRESAEAVPPPGPAALAALKERLAKEKLSGLDIKLDHGSIVVRGEVAADRQPGWDAVRLLHDQQFGDRVPLIAQLTIAPTVKAPKLLIESVWAGESPYLIAGNGERYGIGAVIVDGWRIEDIDLARIVLIRGTDRVEVPL